MSLIRKPLRSGTGVFGIDGTWGQCASKGKKVYFHFLIQIEGRYTITKRILLNKLPANIGKARNFLRTKIGRCIAAELKFCGKQVVNKPSTFIKGADLRTAQEQGVIAHIIHRDDPISGFNGYRFYYPELFYEVENLIISPTEFGTYLRMGTPAMCDVDDYSSVIPSHRPDLVKVALKHLHLVREPFLTPECGLWDIYEGHIPISLALGNFQLEYYEDLVRPSNVSMWVKRTYRHGKMIFRQKPRDGAKPTSTIYFPERMSAF
jgi:hypothetical protein